MIRAGSSVSWKSRDARKLSREGRGDRGLIRCVWTARPLIGSLLGRDRGGLSSGEEPVASGSE